MEGRALGISAAIFYVLPLILAFEGAVQPKAAWHKVQQSKLLWLTVFVTGPAASILTASTWPAAGTVVACAYYMAKLRSTLLIASGIERERRKHPPDGA